MAEETEIVIKSRVEGGQATIDTVKKINSELKSTGDAAESTAKQTSNLTSTIQKLAAVVGVTALASQFKTLVKGSLEAAGAMEQVDIALTTMLGSGEKAKKLTADLITFAKKTPFEIEGIFSSTKQLLAYGIAQEEIISTMSTLGNIAAGVGVDMNRLALVYGQVKTTGHLMGQDLNQFTQAGIPLLAELAKTLGKTQAEIVSLKESGQISFEQVKVALESMTAEGGRFFNLMENQSKTFLGTVSNMSDSFYQVKVALGDALLPVAKEVVASMITWFGNLKTTIENNKAAITAFANAVMAGFSAIGTALGFAFAMISNFIAGVKTLLSLPFVKETLAAAAAVLVFSKGLAVLTIAFRLLTTTAFGWISAIVLATSAIGYFSKGIENMPDFVKIAALQVLKAFEGLKKGIFDFVESVLDKLSLLSGLPMFGWVDDAKKKFGSLKDSAIADLQKINDEIKNIKSKVEVETSAPPAPAETTQTVQQNLLAPQGSSAKEDKEEDKVSLRLAAAQQEADMMNQIEMGASEEMIKTLKQRNEQIAEIEAKRLELDRVNQELARTNLTQNEETILAAKRSAIDQELAIMQEKFDLIQEKTAEQEAIDTEKRIAAKQMLNQALTEKEAAFLEAKKAKDAEDREIDAETEALRAEEDLAFLQSKLITKQQAEDQFRQEQLNRDAARRNQMLKDEAQYGTAVAKLKAAQNTQEYATTKETFSKLSQLKGQENSKAAGITKAFAIYEIGVKTAEAAIKAYTSMVGIPVVGPALGAAAAGVAVAFGAQQMAQAKSQTASFAVGTDFVPSDMTANIHKGEMIIPATFAESIRGGDLQLSGSKNKSESQNGTVNLTVNFSFAESNFVENRDDFISDLSKRMSQLINENVIPAIPTRTAA